MGLFDFLYQKKNNKHKYKENNSIVTNKNSQLTNTNNNLNDKQELNATQSSSAIEEQTNSILKTSQNILEEEKIEMLCTRYNIPNISNYLIELIETHPELLDLLLEQYLSVELLEKINNNNYQLKDISSNDRWLLKYLTFKEEEQKLANLIIKPTILNNVDPFQFDSNIIKTRYYVINCDDLDKLIPRKEKITDTIPSYFKYLSIIKSDTEVIPIANLFESDAKIKILPPTNNQKIKVIPGTNYFDKKIYIEDEITYTKDTIIIMKYDDFLKIAINSEIFTKISNCQIIFEEDFMKITYLKFLTTDTYQDKTNLKLQNNDDEAIKMNHLLYIINNSNLEENKKEFYAYQVKTLNQKLNDDNIFNSFQANHDLEGLVEQIKKELSLDILNDLTTKFNKEDISKKTKPILPPEYNANIFIFNIDKFEELPDETILKHLAKLSEENLVKILNDKRIINKLSKYLNETDDIETKIKKVKKEIQLLSLDLNNDTITFIKNHNIDVDKFLTLPESHIYSESEINPIVKKYGIRKKQERTELSIGEIIGYDGALYSWDRNILFSMKKYFDKNGEVYHTRSLGMLDFQNGCEALKQLELSFKKEAIKVLEADKNKFCISANGLHRYTVLRLHYLNERIQGKLSLKELNKKYQIPVTLSKTDFFKTYCNFMLMKFSN